jgi:FtsP/CotA-like multicopper oxidase with cupredoxin domain
VGVALSLVLFLFPAFAQICPTRPAVGSVVVDPVSLTSQNGALSLNLVMGNYKDLATGSTFYCYDYSSTVEAPTLRVNPGDILQINLTNKLQEITPHPMMHMQMTPPPGMDPDCTGSYTDLSTNIHFHGLNISPTCHQDEVIYTLINPGDPPFHYKTQIPANEPPGLYWYHPHAHGITQRQIMGGASGALIVQGIEKIKPEVAGLTERVLVMRDIIVNGDLDGGSQTLNFVAVNPPFYPLPIINIGASEKQFWRVLNAEGENFLRLEVRFNSQPQNLQLISIDGTPLKQDLNTTMITIPPAGRAEFIMQGPATSDVVAQLYTDSINTGADGDPNAAHPIASIVLSDTADKTATKIPAAQPSNRELRFAGLLNAPVATTRSLYFSEDLSDPDDPKFYITVAGQTPTLFDPNEPPAIITTQGSVEDWTIENHSQEIHAFHMHQIHYMLLARDGVKLAHPDMQDTTTVPPWSGTGPYPSITVRMDFRYPETVGTFVYHCHILDHEDGGMMAKIQVNPKPQARTPAH